MKILRVFLYRTNYTPEDDLVFIGEPPFREMLDGGAPCEKCMRDYWLKEMEGG